LVFAYGLLAALIAMPLAVLAAWQLAGFFAELLNIDADGPCLPLSVVALELARWTRQPARVPGDGD
jgi:hypothetical protein